MIYDYRFLTEGEIRYDQVIIARGRTTEQCCKILVLVQCLQYRIPFIHQVSAYAHIRVS
ncbi:hypothetical protein D3C72_2574550 [compost metagenome]